MSYLYLRDELRPVAAEPACSRPSLTAAAVQAALMLVSNLPMVMVDRAARRLDLRAVRSGMARRVAPRGGHVRAAGVRVRRAQRALGLNAYGVGGLGHAGHPLDPAPARDGGDAGVHRAALQPESGAADCRRATDNALYWYFMTLAWLPLAAIVFLSPYAS